MTTRILFDIETIPDLSKAKVAAIQAGLQAPSNWKDPVKIAKNIAEQLQTKIDKAAVDPFTGQIRIITACHLYDGDIQIWYSQTDEASVLTGFRDWLVQVHRGKPVFIGYNIARFDIPFLNIRMLARSVSFKTPFPAHSRDWGLFFDLCSVFTEHKLDDWLRLFDLPPKTHDNKIVHELPIKECAEYAFSEMQSLRLLTQRMDECLCIRELRP